jgi:haloalkane dehalogenase
VFEIFEIFFVTAFSDQDPVTAGLETVFRERIPGAARAPHRRLAGGGHFLQEDVPGELVEALEAFVRG